jgi:crotonobetaine/carnitine-CoA ligase
VPAPGSELDAASIFAACRTELEPGFVPAFLQIVDAIPKTASEKPQERFLREAFAADAVNVIAQPAGRHVDVKYRSAAGTRGCT